MAFRATAPDSETEGLDVFTLDRLDERIENLKRKPTWNDFLNAPGVCSSDEEDDEWVPGSNHVNELPEDSDSDNHFLQERNYYQSPNTLARALIWTPIALATSPILIISSFFLKTKRWPLGCTSVWSLIFQSISNIIALLLIVLFVNFYFFRDGLEFNNSGLSIMLQRLISVFDSGKTCITDTWESQSILPDCLGVFQDVAVVLVCIVLLLNFHTRWVKRFIILGCFSLFIWRHMNQIKFLFPTPKIQTVDPTYGIANEELVISIDGSNLKEGGTIGWIPYWGCASSSPLNRCHILHVSVFKFGIIRVSFSMADNYIPCYKPPPTHNVIGDYECYPDVQLRVKEKESVPGWTARTGESAADSITEIEVEYNAGYGEL